MSSAPTLRVLCAGDLFITADTLAAATRAELAGGDGPVEIASWSSAWPDEPFGDVDGVREAAGDPGDLAAAVAGAEVLLTHLAPVTAGVLAAADRLRLVGVARGGPVNVDLAAATAAGVPVAYLPGRNLGAVAEFAVGVMIALTRNIAPASRSLADGRWDGSWFRYSRCGPELRTATVGLVGLGAVGLRVAELLRGFGATVLAHDPYADPAAAGRAGVDLVELGDLLGRSDIVSAHARLTDETRGLFGAPVFAAMKDGAYFVNTARGELVDQAALSAALDSGRLGGAALDVFSPEPPDPSDPLPGRPGVLGTPHLAGASRPVAEESAAKVAAAAARYLRTGELEHCANPEVLTSR